MKKLASAVALLLFSFIAPSAFADEAKAPGGATAGATTSTAVLAGKEWKGEFKAEVGGNYFIDVKASLLFKEGTSEPAGVFNTPRAKNVPITSFKLSGNDLSFEASDVEFTRKFRLKLVEGALKGTIAITGSSGRTSVSTVEFK